MSRVARDAGTVAVVTAAARVVGFLRWLVFAWAVGATLLACAGLYLYALVTTAVSVAVPGSIAHQSSS